MVHCVVVPTASSKCPEAALQVAQDIHEFDRVEQARAQDRPKTVDSLCDRVTGEVLIDPVLCSDNWTYCRFSAFDIIDSGCSMPGSCNNKFEILGALFAAKTTATPNAKNFALECRQQISPCIDTVPSVCEISRGAGVGDKLDFAACSPCQQGKGKSACLNIM